MRTLLPKTKQPGVCGEGDSRTVPFFSQGTEKSGQSPTFCLPVLNVATFPQIHRGVCSPGAQRSACRASAPADANPDALRNPRSPAGNASGQRMARMATYWAVQSPMPGSLHSAAMARGGSGFSASSISPPAAARANAANALGAGPRDADRGQLRRWNCCQVVRRGRQAAQTGRGSFERRRESLRQPTREGRRALDRHLLSEDGPYRQCERIEGARHAQARQAADRARQGGIGDAVERRSRRGGRRDRTRRETRANTAASAGTSDVDSSTASRWRSARAVTAIHPRQQPIATVRR